MTITLNKITAVAGLCAVTAGFYAGVQINHPPADVAHVVTTEMAIRETAKAVMAALALAGFAGMFVHNRGRFGVLGVVGYVLLSIGYLAMFANQVIVGAVLPSVAETDPGYVQAYLDAAVGGSSSRRHRRYECPIRHHRSRLLTRRPGLRRRAVPRRNSVTLGLAAARDRGRVRPHPVRAAGVLQPFVRCADGCRADWPRHLAVARLAAPAPKRRGWRAAARRRCRRLAPPTFLKASAVIDNQGTRTCDSEHSYDC